MCDNGSGGDTERILRCSQGDRGKERPISKLRSEHQRKCLQDQSPVKRVADMAKRCAQQEIMVSEDDRTATAVQREKQKVELVP